MAFVAYRPDEYHRKAASHAPGSPFSHQFKQTRLVVLPTLQGLGLGPRVSETAALDKACSGSGPGWPAVVSSVTAVRDVAFALNLSLKLLTFVLTFVRTDAPSRSRR